MTISLSLIGEPILHAFNFGNGCTEDAILFKGNIRSRSAFTSPDVVIGVDNIFAPESAVGSNSVIGNNNVFYPGSSIGDHCDIRHHCKIGAGTAIDSYSIIEDGVTIGDSASIGKKVTIGKNCFIAKGSVVEDSFTLKENSIFFRTYFSHSKRAENKIYYEAYGTRNTPFKWKLSDEEETFSSEEAKVKWPWLVTTIDLLDFQFEKTTT